METHNWHPYLVPGGPFPSHVTSPSLALKQPFSVHNRKPHLTATTFFLRSDYGAKPLPKVVPAPPVTLPPSLPFEANSAYREEFGPKPLPKPPVPQQVKLPQSLPFEGDTVYRSEFVRKENPVCQVARMPPYPQPSYPNNHVFWDKDEKVWY